jgi:N-acyl-D-amino-acid deacylase
VPPKNPLVAIHPRTYGSYPRVLGKYVREENLLTLPEAIRKMTSLPARTLHLRDRGLIATGMCADLVAFDPDEVRETGTFANPASYPKGIKHVVVNGELAVKDEIPTGALAGKVL